MSPRKRRVLQAVLYEVFAIAFVGPVLSFAFDKPATSTLALAVVLSSIALAWNYLFNAMFEAWESRQAVRGRSFARRLAHGIGFEGGLVVILVPVMALWLDIPAIAAFWANVGLLAFFFFYAIAFTWAFDRIFGLPASAAPRDPRSDRFELFRGDERLGTIERVAGLCDYPWYGGVFTPAPAFAAYEPLFDQELKLIDAEDMDAWGAVWARIEGPGLRLTSIAGEQAAAGLQFHIENREARWRA